MLIDAINTLWSSIRGAQYAVFEADTSKVVFVFDTIEELEFRADSSITSYPIESGVLKTDYLYRNPNIIEIVGRTSKKSLLAQGFNFLTDKESSIQKINENLTTYTQGIYNLNIQTKIALRKGFTLQKFTIPENLDTYGMLTVQMTFQEIMGMETTGTALKDEFNADTISAGIVQLLRL